jgi:type VI secretion system protein ImpH
MATTSRPQSLDVNRSFLGRSLREHPGRFEFFQLVRLLIRLNPGKAIPGLWGPPARESVRFSVNNSLAFPPSQIHSLEMPESGPAKISLNFMGLTGPAGLLPFAYTELVRDRARAKDRTLEAFLDLFNHRMISLFYQAWEKYRFFVTYERDQKDRFSKYLMSFVGLGTKGLEKRQDAVLDESFLFYSGLLALQPRSAQALEQILSDYFGVETEVEQFVGAWHTVPADDQCSLDTGKEFSEQLGLGAIAGDEIWDHQSRARVRMGPMPMEKYLDFLPTGRAFEPLKKLVRFFSGNELEFEVQLILKREDVPYCEMGREGGISFLGWTTWMKSGPALGRDPGDTVLLLN